MAVVIRLPHTSPHLEFMAEQAAVLIKDCRREANLTREELARKTGILVSDIVQIEKGRGDVSLWALTLLMHGCGAYLSLEGRRIRDNQPMSGVSLVAHKHSTY